MACGVKWQQVGELDRALKAMRRQGIPVTSDIYQRLWRERGRIFGQIGYKLPREITSLIKLVGHSPGIFQLWHDVESGWMAEARAKPGAPPIYKSVSDEVAGAILKDQLTPELERELLTPDEYYGE